MSNQYKVTGKRPVLDHQPGEQFDHEFTVEEEHDLIAGGRVELVPRPYTVIGTSTVYGTPPGETFEAAFTIDQEAHLVEAGHVERARRSAAKAEKKEK